MISRILLVLAIALAPIGARAQGTIPLIQPRELASGAAAANLGSAGVTASMLASGAAAANLGWSGLSSSVEGTGVQGIDGNTFFIYQAPSTVAQALNQTLRVQRSASYPSSIGVTAGTAQTIWALDYTSPTGSLYEWPITSQMYNQTDSAQGAQNVAVVGYGNKQFKPGATYPSGEIGATWGANFSCNDMTGVVHPQNACIGAEIDNDFLAGVGADPNRERVVLQLAWGGGAGGGDPTSTDHIGVGIMFGANGSPVMDNALLFGGSGAYGIGLNFSGATFNTAPVFLGLGQKIVFDGTTSGTFNWALSDIAGTMALTFGGITKFTVDQSGDEFSAGSLTSAANISANGTVTGGNLVATNAISGPTLTATTVNAATVSLGGGWTASNIAGVVALQYNGSTKFTVDNLGNVFSAGKLSSAASVASSGPIQPGVFTVATLGAYASPVLGMRAAVTDATSCTLNGTLTGGGSVKCPVWFNGTAWVGG